MALLITEDCINCAACEPDCPNEAITAGEEIFVINADKCTECVGHFDTSKCLEVCPADCIVSDPAHVESKEVLLAKFERLSAEA